MWFKSPETPQNLLYVRKTTRDLKTYSSAIVVDSSRAVDLPSGRWRGWAATFPPPARVCWEILMLSTASSGTQLGGPTVTYWDGMSFESDPDSDVWKLAGNRTMIVVTPSPSPSTRPFFITGRRAAAAVATEVVVERQVANLADLPDLRANWGDESEWINDFDRRYADLRTGESERIALETGDDLPVAVDGAADAFGILLLGEQTGRREFRARLVLPPLSRRSSRACGSAEPPAGASVVRPARRAG